MVSPTHRHLEPQSFPPTAQTTAPLLTQQHPSLTLLFSHPSLASPHPSNALPQRPTPKLDPTETYLRTLSTALVRALDNDFPTSPSSNATATLHRQTLIRNHTKPNLLREIQRGGKITTTVAVPASFQPLPPPPPSSSPSPPSSPSLFGPSVPDISSIPASLRQDISLIDCAVELSKCGRRAKVWLLKCLGNYTFGSNESVTLMEFERRAGGWWVCVRLTVVEGVTECA